MPNLWKWRLALEVLRHHGMIHRLSVRGRGILFVLVVIVSTAVEVRRSFVLVWSTVICVSRDEFSHIARRVFV